MNIPSDQASETIKQWMLNQSNIYNVSYLSYPNLTMQMYISNYLILAGVLKEFNNTSDLQANLQNRFESPRHFHCGAIYLMLLKEQNQRMLFDIIKMNGLQDILAFYEELARFFNTQFSNVKEQYQVNIFSLMGMLLEQPFDKLEECYKSFLREFNIYNSNLTNFLHFSFNNFEKICKLQNLAALLFYKFLFILNVEDYYQIQKFPFKVIGAYMCAIWDVHKTFLLSFGREFLINFQVPIQYADNFDTIRPIKDSLSTFSMDLLNNTKMQIPAFYKYNYLLPIPYAVEQKLLFAIFQQARTESVKAHLAILFEVYGYQVNFLGQVVRYLTCLVDFDDHEASIQYRIGETFLIIHQLAEFDADKWAIYLKYIFVDLFFYQKDQKDDHNLQPSAYFLKALHVQQQYEELNGALWFIIQAADNNEICKKRVIDALKIVNKYLQFQRLLQDPNIHDTVKYRLQDIITIQQEIPTEEPIHYSTEQPTKEYSLSDNMDIEFYQPILGNVESEYPESETIQGPQVSVSTQLAQVLKRERLDTLLTNPEDSTLLIKFLQNFKHKQIAPEYKDQFLTELTELLYMLYEDHFYDLDFEYEFNLLIVIIQQNYQESEFLKGLFTNLISKDVFGQHLSLLAYFEKRFDNVYYEQNCVIPNKIKQSLEVLHRLLNTDRFMLLLGSILLRLSGRLDSTIIITIIKYATIDKLQQLRPQLVASINKQYIQSLIQQLGNLDEIKDNFSSQLIITVLESYDQSNVAIVLNDILPLNHQQSFQFWKCLTTIFQQLIKSNKVNETCLTKLFRDSFELADTQTQGLANLLIYIPNTSKKLILSAMQNWAGDVDRINKVEPLIQFLLNSDNGQMLGSQLRSIVQNNQKYCQR